MPYMITNGAGWVAVLYYSANSTRINIEKEIYEFQYRRYFSLAYVRPEHVDILINRKGRGCGCPGGESGRHLFRLATQQETDLWEGKRI